MKNFSLGGGAALGACCLLLADARASAQSCEPALTRSIAAVRSQIDGNAADLPVTSHARLKRSAGLTAASAHWMQNELQLIDDACTRGKDVEATWRLERLQAGLMSHAIERGRAGRINTPNGHRPPFYPAG